MKQFLFKTIDVIGAGFIYLAGAVLALFAGLGGVALILFGIVSSLAVPAVCLTIIWGILTYFGVL